MKLTRDDIMAQVKKMIAVSWTGPADKVVSTARNFALKPTNGAELYLTQYGLTQADLDELRAIGGTSDAAITNSMGGRHFGREESRRFAAMKDRIRDSHAND